MAAVPDPRLLDDLDLNALFEDLFGPDPDPEVQEFLDLDTSAPLPPRVLAHVGDGHADWQGAVEEAKDEFEVDSAATVFSSLRVEGGGQNLDTVLNDARVERLLADLPQCWYNLRIKFLRGHDDGRWAIKDKLDPVRNERGRGRAIIDITPGTRPGILMGIDHVFYQNAYPVTVVIYGLYPVRDPEPTNLAPLQDGDLNCIA